MRRKRFIQLSTPSARGIAIIVASSEISELLRLASRIYVLRSGCIAAEVEATWRPKRMS